MKRASISEIGLIVVFIATLAAFSAFSFANFRTAEERPPVLSIKPSSLKKYPEHFEQYFNAHLAGRESLVQTNAWVKAVMLESSANPKVIVGHDGWLFYDHTAEPGVLRQNDRHLGARMELTAATLEARRAWCEARGIRYFAFVAPDKQSIYPEYLPGRGRSSGPTALDQLVAKSQQYPKLVVLDIRDELRNNKSAGNLYYKTDTHWNVRGSWFGYEATARQVAAWFPEFGGPLPCWKCAFRNRNCFDLARMLGAKEWLTEEFDELTPDQPLAAHKTTESVVIHPKLALSHLKPEVWVRDDKPNSPRVVLFDDSFAQVWFYHRLAEHCSRLVHTPTYGFDEQLIERERPDIVIDQFVERMLQMAEFRRPGDALFVVNP